MEQDTTQDQPLDEEQIKQQLQNVGQIDKKNPKKHKNINWLITSFIVIFVLLIILFISFFFTYFNAYDNQTISTTTTTLNMPTTTTTTPTTTTTLNVPSTTSKINFIIIKGIPNTGKLFFSVPVNTYTSDMKQAFYTTEYFTIRYNEVCKDNEPINPNTRLYFRNNTAHLQKYIELENENKNYCKTGLVEIDWRKINT